MNLMLLGNSCSGKTTLAKMLTKFGYKHLPTGEMTRYLYGLGCTNMPYVMTTIIESLAPDSYCFDHFYIHTMKQLKALTGSYPIVIQVIDKRSKLICHSQDPAKIARKRERFDEQYDTIVKWLVANGIKVFNVINMDTGFDVSNLIEEKIIPYASMPVLIPEVHSGNT